MKATTFKLGVALWWVLAIAILICGYQIKARAQTYGSPQLTISAYKYTNITGQATTTIKSGAGVLHKVCINTPAATGTITIYDNTAGSGTKIATITAYASTNPCLSYDAAFSTGLTVVTATASSDITISYY